MMAASSGGKHHQPAGRRRNRAASSGTVPAVGSVRQPDRRQSVLRAGALGGVFVAGASSVIGVPPAAAGVSPVLVHRDDIRLTDLTGTTSPTPTFDESLRYLLDDMLGVGTKTLPQLITASNPSLTVGQLLGEASPTTTVSTSLHLDDMMNLLGLNNITVTDVMDALNLSPTKTVDQVLQQMSLADVNLDQFLTPLGVPSTQTIYGVAGLMSLTNVTLGDFMAKIGPVTNPAVTTVKNALMSIGLGGFYNKWFTGSSLTSLGLGYLCTGVKGTVENALNCVHTQYNNADTNHPNVTLSSNQTVGYLLTHLYQLQPTAGPNNTTMADFTHPVGNYTIGQILNFNNTTTVQQMIDGLQVNMGVTAGQWSGGISPTTGSPVGNPVITTVVGNAQSTALSGKPGTITVAPADDDQGPGLAPTVSLGHSQWGDLLTWVNLPPSESLADMISKFWLNDVQLGHYTVGDALEGLVVNPGALGSGLTDNTLVDDFLTSIGFNNMTLDQLIGLN